MKNTFFYNEERGEYGILKHFMLGVKNNGLLVFFREEETSKLFGEAVMAGADVEKLAKIWNLSCHMGYLWQDDDFAKIEGPGFLWLPNGDIREIKTSVWKTIEADSSKEDLLIVDSGNGQYLPNDYIVVGCLEDIKFEAKYVKALDYAVLIDGVYTVRKEQWIRGDEEIILIARNENLEESKTWYTDDLSVFQAED